MSDVDEYLRVYLAPRGQCPGVGPERGSARLEGIAKYVSPHGSVRYVLYAHGSAVAVVQLVTMDGRTAKVANAYVVPELRRRKLASLLLKRARQDFRVIEHSTHLSESGRGFAKATSGALRRRSR